MNSAFVLGRETQRLLLYGLGIFIMAALFIDMAWPLKGQRLVNMNTAFIMALCCYYYGLAIIGPVSCFI